MECDIVVPMPGTSKRFLFAVTPQTQTGDCEGLRVKGIESRRGPHFAVPTSPLVSLPPEETVRRMTSG
jgi:hypothetical protein